MDLISHPTQGAALLLVLMLGIFYALYFTFLVKLKKWHPQLWLHTGLSVDSPVKVMVKAWVITGYLFNKRYDSSGLQNGILFCEDRRWSLILAYYFALASIFVFILSSLLFGLPGG
ncbi:hypothetical protein [Psychrobium sp. 1_MG-2023]|uniref:hypothetical protein n=1 Tax=Psychrobium sp. 1_MG-2023 TaxID=3062624 RepID=UPI000C326145|nr:hypothetical protein [Psychrobium sp. 1_MG-2023]MDP2562715.1 hypothetical protein [Psychrobium sp. 1_MG-2023]PKF54022.1 hypothetical protein CW748_17185 [Alteromonadales bacterium alter-6D02]